MAASSTTISWAVAMTTRAKPRWRFTPSRLPASAGLPVTVCVDDTGGLLTFLGRAYPAPRPDVVHGVKELRKGMDWSRIPVISAWIHPRMRLTRQLRSASRSIGYELSGSAVLVL